jgi:hypothetical protein
MTSDDIIESVKRRILVPTSQNTFKNTDILKFANEEMMITQVPSILEVHEEYFVHKVEIDLEAGRDRYPVPDRAIGMKFRDIFWADSNGNFYELSRIPAEDKAFFQRNIGANAALHKYYIEGNDIIFTPLPSGGVIGKLVMYIYLRPNQLVNDDRAAICTSFLKKVTVDVTSMVNGDTITINNVVFTAVSGAPSTNEFQIDASSIVTASNLVSVINTNGIAAASNGTPVSSVVTMSFTSQSITITTTNSTALSISSQLGLEFDSLPSTYLDVDTKKTESLYVEGELIDFLQTKPGHVIRKYDVEIEDGAISGDSIFFDSGVVPTDFIVGDYVCLAHESIIPQLPPDLHNVLAERTAMRILSALGDAAGVQESKSRIAEMEARQGNLLDNRVDGSNIKINGRHSILRYQGMNSRRRL